jgi:trimethylamine--corrinoid protein Co-methyltransferase
MRLVGNTFNVMNQAEVGLIHQGVLRILAEMGMEVQNESLLQACAETGFSIDFDAQRVRFPVQVVEKFIAETSKFDWENAVPKVEAKAGIYSSLFHDPETGELVPWDESRLAFYFALAQSLPHIGKAMMLGSRLPVPAPLESLYERYHSWKYGGAEFGSSWGEDICPYLYDLYQVWAGFHHKPIQEVFKVVVHLAPAMKLGRPEALQVEYFRQRGLRVVIEDLVAMGASAPVTLAGAVTLNLAEQFAIGLLNWALFGEKHLHIGGSISPLDMRTTLHAYGRPETAAVNLMNVQIARFYGVTYSGHGGLTNAKLPSAEAGYQKALTGMPILFAGGNFYMDAGLLSCDEICSPAQLTIDNEFLGTLTYLSKEFQVTPETLGLDVILAAGPGGTFITQKHTARHFRAESWQPTVWSRYMLQPWISRGSLLDSDLARQSAMELKKEDLETFITEDCEKDMLGVIDAAQKKLVDGL